MRRLPFILFPFLLAACVHATPTQREIGPTFTAGPVAFRVQYVYLPFAAELVGHGKPALLFFHRSGDRFSDASERFLSSVYATGAVKISTYRVNFDTADKEKLQYHVFIPDTFVLLDRSGNREGEVVHPTPAELRSLVFSGSLLRR